MPKANVFNMAGEKIGEIELSEAIFGIEPNKSVLHDSVKNHLANCRQGTQSALTKGTYSYVLNKKVKRLALKSALSAKAAENEIVVVDGLKVEEIKTSVFNSFLKKIGVEKKALVVTESVDEKVVKSARNIAGVETTIASILSPYMILTNGVMVVDKAALAKIEEVYA